MKSYPTTCAIYTRKSSDVGLDQEYNSLHAQREACLAYIKSQQGQGWVACDKIYDDGGYSGGNMERPGLKKLMSDIKAGKINVIVVYKIDRLTRSLIDFARLVDLFDQYDVTFVSVTQSFNTTTSMGRLTLNVLLSFAQFERELTGERIRDKIASSKKKGIWMGGVAPAGYASENGKLKIVEKDAKIIRSIFDLYLELQSVKLLKKRLEENNILTPKWVSKTGREHGGKPFSRGHLYKLLKNQIYIGKIKHKDTWYEGCHDAIVSDEIFYRVQDCLENNHQRNAPSIIPGQSLLQGKLYDTEGNIYTPTYTKKKNRRYCYYVSSNMLQYKTHPKGVLARMPAHEVEKTVGVAIKNWIKDEKNILKLFPDADRFSIIHVLNLLEVSKSFIRQVVDKITVCQDVLNITLSGQLFQDYIHKNYDTDFYSPAKTTIDIKHRFEKVTGNNGAVILKSKDHKTDPFDRPANELERIIRGMIWREEYFDGRPMYKIAEDNDCSYKYVRRSIVESLEFGCL
jgi:DNA invertase Pin-like site-specific DNA recombinase